jgi:hypothetical protein
LKNISVNPNINLSPEHFFRQRPKDLVMTTFIQPSFPTRHAGVERMTSAADAVRGGINSTKSLSAMLLAAMVSALVVVADQLMDTWAEGHLMLAWIALWVVAFAAVAVFAGAARKVATALVQALDAWSARIAQRRADERLWSSAMSDPRIMADLNAAMSRSHLN